MVGKNSKKIAEYMIRLVLLAEVAIMKGPWRITTVFMEPFRWRLNILMVVWLMFVNRINY